MDQDPEDEHLESGIEPNEGVETGSEEHEADSVGEQNDESGTHEEPAGSGAEAAESQPGAFVVHCMIR